MATNTPAKRPDVIRLAVEAAVETPVTFHGVVSLIGFTLQIIGDADLYISLEPGGTFSADNYYTLKSGYVIIHRDINWTPPEEALYLRSTESVTAEIWYWG